MKDDKDLRRFLFGHVAALVRGVAETRLSEQPALPRPVFQSASCLPALVGKQVRVYQGPQPRLADRPGLQLAGTLGRYESGSYYVRTDHDTFVNFREAGVQFVSTPPRARDFLHCRYRPADPDGYDRRFATPLIVID